jgi:Putative adhesin
MNTTKSLKAIRDTGSFAKTIMLSAVMLAVMVVGSAAPAGAQNEKRTVFTENNFHWQGNLKVGQTLEVVNQNGDIEASGASGDAAQVEGTKHDGDENELFIEVVEYSDGVTVCAVYAKDKTPGRCHRGGVSSESNNWNWHGHRAKINFNVQVPKGVRLSALTTNGGVRGHDLSSVVKAATTNGNVEVSTSEWASARTTNGGVRVAMGNAKWSGELVLATTNGSVHVTMPAGSEFAVEAATTNGGIHTDFPITVQGSFDAKNLSGTVGAGGRELKVATTNGGIELKMS